MSNHFQISEDANGVVTLFITGAWSSDLASALGSGGWRAIAIRAPSWADYTPLLPYAEKISWIRVPLGPDSSAGFEELRRLTKIQSTDVLDPPIDFRKFADLRELECIWEKKRPLFFANQDIDQYLIHGIAGADLSWVPEFAKWRSLELRGGSLKSLVGLSKAKDLQELRISELRRCTDVSAIADLHSLEVLELDAPNASFANLDWVLDAPMLRKLTVYAPVQSIDWSILGRHRSLLGVSVLVDKDSIESDDQIASMVASGGRKPLSVTRHGTKQVGVNVAF